jgi:hypothetical protein
MNKFVRWATQYLIAAGSMFAILVSVDMGQGTSFADAWASALAWAVLSSAIFIGARYYQTGKGTCAVCEVIDPATGRDGN